MSRVVYEGELSASGSERLKVKVYESGDAELSVNEARMRIPEAWVWQIRCIASEALEASERARLAGLR